MQHVEAMPMPWQADDICEGCRGGRLPGDRHLQIRGRRRTREDLGVLGPFMREEDGAVRRCLRGQGKKNKLNFFFFLWPQTARLGPCF